MLINLFPVRELFRARRRFEFWVSRIFIVFAPSEGAPVTFMLFI